MSPIMIAGGVLGQQKMTKPMAAAAAKLFGLSASEQALLNEVPMRGTGTPMPPTDPLLYRFYELVLVNGPAWKALIEEEFGDGIMSAIDSTWRSSATPTSRATASRSPCRANSCRSNITARRGMRRRMG
jgi:cyanase